ncbi:MAG: endonuclease [Gemmatimonadetes bacterium]|nr:endonuclease [Gemmatimonadota bacterium]
MARKGAPRGTVYVLHFSEPYRHAKHYTGWTTDLPARLAQHAAGTGARLMEVITEAGIGFTLARTWEGTRALERSKKRQGGASRYCPICKAQLALPLL